MNSTVKMAITLACFVVAFVAALDITYLGTKDAILAQEQAKQEDALKDVLPAAVKFEAKSTAAGVEYFIGHDAGGAVVGRAIIVAGKGYAGPIKTVVGLDKQNKISGISIVELSETPGLGMRCKEIASNMTLWDVIGGKSQEGEPTRPWYELQFVGLDPSRAMPVIKPEMQDGSYLKQNGISTLTGATITSQAIADSIVKGVAPLLKGAAK